MKFSKTNIRCVIISILLMLISFVAGNRYAHVDSYMDDIVFILNMNGSNILEVNKQLNLTETKPIDEVIENYNRESLFMIGCSGWLTNFDYLDKKKLKQFYDGIDLAITRANLQRTIESCIQTVVDKNQERKKGIPGK